MIKKNSNNEELSASLKDNLKLRKKQITDRDNKKITGKSTIKIGIPRLDLNAKN
jgi:hypothetical protein